MIAIMFSLGYADTFDPQERPIPVPAFMLLLVPIARVVAGIWLAARASAEPDDLPAW